MDLKVDPAKLAELADLLSKAAAGIQESLRQLNQQSGRLTNAWEGEAKEAYVELFAQFSTDSDDWAAMLASAASAVGELGKDYSAADKGSAASIPH